VLVTGTTHGTLVLNADGSPSPKCVNTN